MGSPTNESNWQESFDQGIAAFERGRYAKAEEFFLAAMKDAECFPETDQRLAKTLNNMAALCHTQGKYAMAEEYYLRSLAIHERNHGQEHSEVAINLHNLAALYSATKKFEQAEPLYKRAIEIREKLNGQDHSDLLPVLTNYAQLLRRIGRDTEALVLEARAQSISSIHKRSPHRSR
jgi:tetratricopeptide (TPR) repeat protein